MTNILVFNTGSSSVKFALFQNSKKIIFGKCDRIKNPNSHLVINNYQKVIPKKIQSFEKAAEIIIEFLQSKNLFFSKIAHRVVHGGAIKKPSLINKKIKKTIKEYSQFAPLHNPPELEVIDYCKKFKKPQYAVFDTAFFEGLPEKSKTYAIPKKIIKKFKIRRYGFHGISHKFVSQNLKGKTITCHLGNGVSIAAIKNKKPIDTSMGLTPLEGLMMGTRAGNLDPGLLLFLEKKSYNLDKILNNESGFKALTNKTDIRDIISSKDKHSKLAIEIFIYKVIEYIGAYIAALEGLDNLVFTGGIGENIPEIRKKICNNFSFMGLKIDNNKNSRNSYLISEKSSKIKVYVIKTDEEMMIMREVTKIK